MLLAGTLHDIGKISVPDEILMKPGRLTDAEFEILKRHPQDGHDLLAGWEEFCGVLDVVLMHHEAYDGRGYPLGLAGEDIPHEARLFAVVDAFDAMTSDRCYRPAMTGDNAVYEIWRNRGRQFDPAIADAFLRLYRKGLLEHIMGYSDYGIKMCRCPKCGPVIELPNGQHLDDEVICPLCCSRFAIAGIAGSSFRLEYLGQVAPSAVGAVAVAP